jgi:hypothetical protein
MDANTSMRLLPVNWLSATVMPVAQCARGRRRQHEHEYEGAVGRAGVHCVAGDGDDVAEKNGPQIPILGKRLMVSTRGTQDHYRHTV